MGNRSCESWLSPGHTANDRQVWESGPGRSDPRVWLSEQLYCTVFFLSWWAHLDGPIQAQPEPVSETLWDLIYKDRRRTQWIPREDFSIPVGNVCWFPSQGRQSKAMAKDTASILRSWGRIMISSLGKKGLITVLKSSYLTMSIFPLVFVLEIDCPRPV